MSYQVWAKWRYCDPQVEASFETNREADTFIRELEASQEGNANFVDAWIQSSRFTEYLETEFSEDF